MLRNLVFKQVMDTSTANLIEDFFVPALAASVRYDRGVGYFSSGWLRIAAEGMASFAENRGRARWITSPILSKSDWQALRLGHEARTKHILRDTLLRDISSLSDSLETKTLSALAWLVADGVITFKIALPRNKLELGEFHDKFGIFSDLEGNRLVFNGSYNDSIKGTYNYESIKIFSSWEASFARLVDSEVQRFERLWTNMDPNVQVYEIPQIHEALIKFRAGTRPYREESQSLPSRMAEADPTWTVRSRPSLAVPDQIILRDYQIDAVEAWIDAGYRGIFEMATGTGKTITALSAAVRLLSQAERFIIVVACPYKHLVNQWANEMLAFGFRPVKAAESKAKWQPGLSDQLRAYRKRYSNVVAIVTTNQTLQSTIPDLLAEYWSDVLLVVDEVHYAGAPTMLKTLPPEAPWRLGLSATPIRHYDSDGTEAVLDYFQDIVFSFPLEKAIGTYLTPYYYHPIPVEMSRDEFEQYCSLTDKLRKHVRSDDEPLTEAGLRIAIKRARVLNNSQAKLHWVDENINDYAPLEHTLFYVGDRIFRDVLSLLGARKHIRVHEFTHRITTNDERQRILDRFSSGELQALVAMKCLDEGVDVPPTRTAYFLASSGNPREFIQRRGRILRLHEGKEFATVVDLISIPPRTFIEEGVVNPEYGAVRAAVKREYARVKEFASLALNRFAALDEIFHIADQLDLLDE